MTAIVYSFVRSTTRESDLPDLALITAFSLAGMVLTLALVYFGIDVGAGIQG